jgi:predicted enzyme related to lactoylglutathione lyase
MANTIVWADIPVIDMDRARKFYGAVLQAEIPLMDGAGGEVALLPMAPGDAGADLVRSDTRKPGDGGCTVYLNSNGDPEGMIERAVEAGGKVETPVTDMGEMVGFIGFFVDSEGNRVGVHKPPKMG